MDPARALTPEQLVGLTGKLAGLRWSWSVAELDRALTELGWSVAAGPTRSGVVLRVGLAPVTDYAELSFSGPAATVLSAMVTAGAVGESEEAVAFRRDAFATAVRAVGAVLGAPADRRPGPAPEVRWAAASGILRVRDGGVFVELALLSPEYATSLDEEVARLADSAAEPSVDEEEW
ncbi:hypothetical protein GCM10027280_22710 [Micromonospora polyrhachis]|uniref:Uncharacterized protein n=1 Tax=Micromonospora polyrhachis TaxID=1282883 RepID=A0A7W7SZQ1_9ACTN|nr:DUF6301 family protein [Micromonospora polyrhachis]MBB4962595.1 hypothetical protein [Micromonospora polyrhachis]